MADELKQQEFDTGIKVDGQTDLNGPVNIGGDLNVTGNISFPGVASANLIPSGNLAYSIGEVGRTWAEGHFRNLLANTTHTIFRNVKATFPASVTGYASVQIPHGTAPSSPSNGDIWTTATTFNIHVGSATKSIAFLDSNITGSAATATALATSRTIELAGVVTGSASFNGTANATITVAFANSYYNQIQSDARFANLTAAIFTGNVLNSANGTTLGSTTRRWAGYFTSVDASGNVNISGSLTVAGSPIDTSANSISTSANGIIFVGGGTNGFSLTVTRGGSANSGLVWNESTDKWQFNTAGTTANAVIADGGTYAITVTGDANNASYSTTSGTANNSTNFGGQAATYYTNIAARLGYTPVNKAGDTITGPVIVTANVTTYLSAANTTGYYHMGNTGARYLAYDGTKYILPGAALHVNGSAVVTLATDGRDSGVDTDLIRNTTPSDYFLTLVPAANASVALTTLGALPSATYTAADILTKIKTVDGASSGLDTDLIQNTAPSAYFLTLVPAANAAVALTTLGAVATSSYTAADVLTKLLTVDVDDSGLNATTLASQNSTYYLNASNMSSGTLPSARLTGSYSISITGAAGAVAWDDITSKPTIVNSFNTRTGAVTLANTDVTTALGYTPIPNATNTWLVDSAGASRMYFANGSLTYFQSPANGFEWRNVSGTATATLSSTGNFVATGEVTAYSDFNLKDELEEVKDALEIIRQFNGYRYVFNEKSIRRGSRSIGVIAQEVERVLPELVVEGLTYKSVNYNGLIAVLIQAIKELDRQVNG